MTSQGDFTPPVKAGYKADGAYHRRNWRALTDFLRTNFISTDHLQDGSVSGIKLQDLAVTDAKIVSLAVDKLTAGTLSADVLLGSVIKTSDSGQRVEIDANGIRLNDGTQDTVNMPVSGDASFLGTVTANSLSSQASTLGGATQVDVGGSFVFTSALADPSAGPTIAWTYVQVTPSESPLQMRGIDYDATNTRVLACDAVNKQVYGFNASTGATEWSEDFGTGGTGFDTKPYGVTRMGSFIYIATRSTFGSADKFILEKWDLTGGGAPNNTVATYSANLPGGGPFTNWNHFAGLTNDGTNVYLCWTKNTGDVMVTAWNSSLALGSTFTLDAGFETGSRFVYDIQYKVIDGGTWWLLYDNSATSVFRVNAYNGSHATLAAENFDLPADSRGLAFDGTVFLTASPTLWRKHTTWRSSQTVEHAKYTWYQVAGTYESLASAQSHVTYVQRAGLRVSWPTIVSPADRARVYMLENGSTSNPATGAMKLQGTETGTVQTYSTYSSGGAADPSSNTFPAATPAVFILPRKSSAPSSPVEGQMYHNTSTHKAQIYDGTSWQNLW